MLKCSQEKLKLEKDVISTDDQGNPCQVLIPLKMEEMAIKLFIFLF